MSEHEDNNAPAPVVDPNLVNLLNTTNAMFANMSLGFALQGVLSQIKPFTGYNIPLKDFVEDIRNGSDLLPQEAEESYVRALIGKLKGAARDSTYRHVIATLDNLITHLKQRFAPNQNYSYYSAKINELRMNRDDHVGTFYDKLNILLHCARSAVMEENPTQTDEKINLIMKPLEDIAIRTYG